MLTTLCQKCKHTMLKLFMRVMGIIQGGLACDYANRSLQLAE